MKPLTNSIISAVLGGIELIWAIKDNSITLAVMAGFLFGLSIFGYVAEITIERVRDLLKTLDEDNL